MIKTAEISGVASQLAELVRQVQAGDEVLLTQAQKPVAKLVSVATVPVATAQTLNVTALKGHKVLTSQISQAELADELFGK